MSTQSIPTRVRRFSFTRRNRIPAAICDIAPATTRITILISLTFILAIHNSIFVQASLTIGGVSSTSACYDALSASSGNDNLVGKNEYVLFINIMSDNYFTYPQFDSTTSSWANLPVTDFNQLPLELQMNFNKLACGGEFISCPNAYLVADGAGKGESPTDQQTIYLYEVCSSSEEAVDDAKAALEVQGTASPVASPGSGEPTAPPVSNESQSESPSSNVDLSNALAYYSTFRYQILMSSLLKADDVIKPDHQMNMDLVIGMNSWSEDTCQKWNGGTRLLRGGQRSIRRLFVSTGQESSIVTNVTNVVCNNATSTTNTNASRMFNRLRSTRQTTPQSETNVGTHCIEITHDQTYHLVLENYPDKVSQYVSAEFENAVIDGSYLNMIPQPSRSTIEAIFLSDSGDKDESNTPEAGRKPRPSPVPSPMPITLESIVGTPEDSGSNTPAIAASVTVALTVAIIGLFITRQKMRDRDVDLPKDDNEIKSDLDGDEVDEKRRKKIKQSDDNSSSSESSFSSSSGSSSGYSSKSSSTSSRGTSVTGGENGPASTSASDTDSYASYPRASTPVHNSIDSDSSVDEASLVEERSIEDSISDDNAHDDEGQHQGSYQDIDLNDPEGVKIPHENFDTTGSHRSKESSYGGISSSTNTESAESLDPNLIDGSTRFTRSSDTDEIDELTVDKELLPGSSNPALNPIAQQRVTMMPTNDTDDEGSAYSSDDSGGGTFIRRSDETPMQYEIETALERGDWNAVAETAAALTTKSSNQSYDYSAAETTSDIEELLDSGNWSGIVAVAAQYADDASMQSKGENGSASGPRFYGDTSPTRSISSASVETVDEDASSAYPHSNSSAAHTTQGSYATDDVPDVYDLSSMRSEASAYTHSSAAHTSQCSYATDDVPDAYDLSSMRSEASGSSAESTNSFSDSHTGTHSSFSGTGTHSQVSQEQTNSVNQSTVTRESTACELDDPEEKQLNAKYRAEVERLVKRVLPDEVNKIDIIMTQFKGREKRLIKTLRDMHKDSIAHRAQAAVKKEATRSGWSTFTDDHTASSEDPSARSSTYGSKASASASVEDDLSMGSTEIGRSITGRSVNDSSDDESESYYHRSHSEYSGSKYSRSRSSGTAESVSTKDSSRSWRDVVDHARNVILQNLQGR